MSGVNLKMKFKLNETGNKSIQEILNSQFKNVGPFSKESDQNQSDVMSGLSDLWKAMEKGVELKSTKVHKEHLVSFVKAIAIHQGWVEEIVQPTGDDETGEVNNDEVNDSDEDQESKTDDDENDQKIERSKSVEKALNVNSERKNLHNNVCKFYRSAKCKYGITGKDKDKRGNICQYDHPPICHEYRKFEKNPEKGCKEKECVKMHYNFCQWYHDCKDMDNCKLYHPKRKTKPMKSTGFQPREGSRPKRANECKNCDSSGKTNQGSFQTRDENRSSQPKKRTDEHNSWESHEKMNFLGQHYPSQIPSWVWENRSPAYPYKQPFSNQGNMQDQHKKEMRGILTSMEKLFNQL